MTNKNAKEWLKEQEPTIDRLTAEWEKRNRFRRGYWYTMPRKWWEFWKIGQKEYLPEL